MAKKKETDVDDFDLDDFDVDFNFTDSPEPSPKDRRPIIDTSVNAVKGFKNTVANKGFMTRVLRKALPKGFVDAFDQAERVVTKGRALYNGAAQEIRPAYTDLERAAREISPIVRNKGKKGLADTIDKVFGKDKGGSNQRFDPDEASISDSLAEIYKLQAQDDEKKEVKERAIDQIKERTTTRRHTDIMGQQTIMADGINMLVGYQKQITSRYQQKMLELNFRQYYAQRDMLGTLQAYARDSHTQLETIIHNTALPDILKMQASEQFVNQARQKMFGKVQDRVGDYFRNYTDKVFENIEKEVNGFAQNISMGMQMGAQLVDAQRMGMEYDVDSGGLGGAAGSGLGQLFGSWLGKKGARVLNRNARVQNLGAKVGYHANNIPEFLNELRNNNRFYGDWRDKGMDVARRILPGPFQRNTQLEGQDELHGGMPTMFDNQTHKTINEILPGYLSRILQSLESARQGKPVSRLVYNKERNKFTVQRERTADTAAEILDDRKISAIRSSADAMVNRIDAENKLSPEARKALADSLINEADKGGSFSPARFATGGVEFSSDARVHREITGHLRGRYGVDAFGKMGDDAENYNRAALDNSSFKMLRETMPDVYATINRMVNTGSAEDLRALGILVSDPNNPRKEMIDYSFLQQRMAGGDWTIDDLSDLGAGGKSRSKGRGRGSRGRPPGAGRGTPPPIPPGPVPPRNDTDSVKLAGAFDRFGDLITASLSKLGVDLGGHLDKLGERVDALGVRIDALGTKIEEHSVKQEAKESVLWLNRIAKLLSSINKGGIRRGRRRPPTVNPDGSVDAEFDDEPGEENWDEWRDEDGDIFDRARGGFRRGARGARSAFGRAKAFGGRQYRRGRAAAGRAGRFAGAQLGKAKDWLMDGKSLFGRIGDVAKGAMSAAGTLHNMFQEVFDIYTAPDAESPVMTAAKMRAGHYFNRHTNDPIAKFSDIKGSVVDENGDVVLTEEDIRRGLYGKNGKPVGGSLMRGVVGAVSGLVGRVFGVPQAVLSLAARTARKTLSMTRNAIDGPEDVYVRGEESPRLLAIIMRRQGYRSKATGRVIKRPSDIDGPVVDIEGNEVLSADDILKGLVDSQSRPVVGLGGKLLRMAKGGFGLIGKAAGLANRVRKYAWNTAKRGARAVGRGIRGVGRFLAKGFNFQANIGFGVGGGGQASGAVLDGLEAIYNLLDDRLPGESKFRAGSWQEKYSRRATPGETKKKLERAAEGSPILKYLMMFGGAVMSGFAWLKSKFGDFFSGVKTLFSAKRGADALGGAADAAAGAGGRRGRGGLLRRTLSGAGRLAKGAGRLALGALPFLGQAAMSIGGAVVGVLGAPLTIAIGVAAAGYFAYKYFKGRPQPLQRLRLAEYGFDPSDKEAMKKVIEMEGYLLESVSVQGGKASIGNVNTDELLKRAGIPDDPAAQQAFTEWYRGRFIHVFLRNVSALKQVGSTVSLLEVDDKLDKGLKADFASATREPANSGYTPYSVGGQPFADIDPLTTGAKAVDDEIAAIRKEFAQYKKATAVKSPAQQVTAAIPGAPAMPTPTGQAGKFQPSVNAYITPSEKTGGYEPGIAVQQWTPGANRLLDDLTAVRMRLYGLGTLDVSQVNALTTLESNLAEVISIGNDGKVKMTMAPEGIYKANAGLFGRNPTDGQAQTEWVTWFNYRFLPVYSQFISALWGINRNIKPGLAWKYLRPEDMLSVAELLKGVRANTPDGAVSVWAVHASAFAGVESNQDITSIDTNLTSLRTQVKNNQFQERTPNVNAASQKQGNGTTGTNSVASNTTPGNAAKPGFFQRVKNWFTGNGDAPSTALGGAGLGTGYSGGMALGGAGGGGGPTAVMGSPIMQPGNGTGGDINQIPQPEGDGSWDALKKTIVAAANMAGVDPGLMASMAFVESNFRAAVKPGTSAAQGLYQFIPSTWRSMMQKYAAKYGIDPNTPPSDPRANALMGAEYLKENQKILEQKLGRPVTGTDLYLSHFLGGAGGPRLLKAPSGDLAQNHADAAAVNANRTVFFAGGRPKTVAEVIAWANKRIEGDGGKFMTEAQSLAGNPGALKAANDPQMDAANDATGGTAATGPQRPSDDGDVANARGQAQAASMNNASTGMPTAQPTPGPTGAGSGNGARSGIAVSGGDNAPTPKDTDNYVSDVQTSARTARTSAQMDSADAMLDVQREQLEVQKTMSSHLARLVELFQGGQTTPASAPAADSPAASTPQTNPSDPRRNGASNAGAQRVNPAVSMKRTGS